VVWSESFPSLTKCQISERKIGKNMTLNMTTHLNHLMKQHGTLKTCEQHPLLNATILQRPTPSATPKIHFVTTMTTLA